MAHAVLRAFPMIYLRTALVCAVTLGASGCFLFHSTDDRSPDAGLDAGPPVDGDVRDRDAFVVLDAGHVSWDSGLPSECPDRAPAPAGACPAEQCGDGDRDTCEVCTPCYPGGGPPLADAGTCCTTESEQCDGADLGGTTCEALGYAGGELGCGDWCGFDATGCERCESDSRIVACGTAPVEGSAPTSLSLTTLDGSIVIAWVSDRDPATGAGAARVARLDPSDLSVTKRSGCLGVSDARRVAVTHAGAGLLLAVERPAGLEILPLDGDLAERGPVRRIDGAAIPVFAPRPDAGPLLTYLRGLGFAASEAALLSLDGDVQWQTPLFDTVIEAQYGSAVFVGDGFLVGQRSDGVRIARVELDGTVSSRALADHSETEYPQLVWTGSAVHLTYSDFGGPTGHIDFATLDTTGARVTAPRQLGSIPTFFNVAPMVARGDDVAILFGVYTGGTGRGDRAEVGVYGPDGTVRTTPFPLDRDPGQVIEYRVASLDGDVIAAWLTTDYPGAIQVARVAP